MSMTEVPPDHQEECGPSAAILPDVIVTKAENKNQDGCVRMIKVYKGEMIDHIGFNLTRSQWDPYPWVKSVDRSSVADEAGLHEGDCLLKVNGEDLLGRKISDIAQLVHSSNSVQLLVWSNRHSSEWDPEALICGPMPDTLRRLTKVVSGVLAALECPICCCTVRPPAVTCPRGHLLCAPCRQPLSACPLCRTLFNSVAPLRNLLADEVYNNVVEAFDLLGDKAKGKLTESLFGNAKIIKNDQNVQKNATQFSAHDDTDKRLKWGTQRLLQRLLPGRARSTGNIAKAARSPTRTICEDRDISRSLSNLDVTRCTNSVIGGSNSMNSLACTTGGSYASLPHDSYTTSTHDDINGFMDEDASERTPMIGNDSGNKVQNHISNKYYCPIDQECQCVSEDVQKHILQIHNVQITSTSMNVTHISCEGDNKKSCLAILHPTEEIWFYPKCERNNRNGGIMVWCWAQCSTSVCLQYQLTVEVYSTTQNNEENMVKMCTNDQRMNKYKEDQHFEDLVAHSHNQTEKKSDISVKEQSKTLLKLVTPVSSLNNMPWTRIVQSEQTIFLDKNLLNEPQIKISIDKVR